MSGGFRLKTGQVIEGKNDVGVELNNAIAQPAKVVRWVLGQWFHFPGRASPRGD